jgi:cytochrome P450
MNRSILFTLCLAITVLQQLQPVLDRSSLTYRALSEQDALLITRFVADPITPTAFLDFAKTLRQLLDELGRLIVQTVGNGRFVMLSDPEAVREVFRGDPAVLHSGEANSLFTATVGRQRYALVLMTVIPIRMLSGSRWVPLFRQLSDLDDDLFAFIATRRRGRHSPAGENVLDDLLAAAHEDGTPLEDREVRDALITILIAGHDTTALALAWALGEIAEHPEVVDHLTDELARITGGGPPDAGHLPALEFLEGAIRECLRLRPVAPFVVRKTVRPFAVGGREYPAGVVLCPCSYLVHRREELYPEPGRFRPERFLERKFGPHEWFPFEGGNRVCLGMPFALYEMRVLLATVLSQVRPSRPAGARARARRYGIVLGHGVSDWLGLRAAQCEGGTILRLRRRPLSRQLRHQGISPGGRERHSVDGAHGHPGEGRTDVHHAHRHGVTPRSAEEEVGCDSRPH